MAPRFASSPLLRGCCLAAALALLGSLGCHKSESGAKMYVYDSASNSVLVWKDISTVYAGGQTGGTVPAANFTLTSSLFPGPPATLAWGGMDIDANADMLYLVSQAGVVTRVSNASTQTGDLDTNQSNNVIQFQLGASGTDQFPSGSVFGQASVDPNTHALYVQETSADGTGTRVWCIEKANLTNSSVTYTPAANYTFAVTNDTWGSGVTAGASGLVYGLFGGGTALTDPITNTNVSSPRLRQGKNNGTAATFPFNASSPNEPFDVVFGDSTGLTSPLTYGALAYDGLNNVVYAFAQPVSTWPTTTPIPSTAKIQLFQQSAFSAGGNQAPNKTLTSVANNLRIIYHPQESDWLVGATYTPTDPTTTVGPLGTGSGSLLIWKSPSGGNVEATAITLSGASSIMGMAVGGD